MIACSLLWRPLRGLDLRGSGGAIRVVIGCWAAIVLLNGQGALAASKPEGVNITYPQNNGVIEEVIIPVLREAYSRLGIVTSFTAVGGLESLQMANDGRSAADAVHSVGMIKDFPNLVAVSEPLLFLSVRAFTAGKEFKIDGWESLRPYRLCVKADDVIPLRATESMERQLVPDYNTMFKVLAAGQCEVAVGAEYARFFSAISCDRKCFLIVIG